MIAQRLTRPGRAAFRTGTAFLAGAALWLAAAGCANQTQAPLAGSNLVKGNLASLGCYAGSFRMVVRPATARQGQTVTLTANGPRRVGEVETESWGLLGTASHGHFAGTYNLAASVRAGQKLPDVPVGPAFAVAGTGLPNRPLYVKVPPVSSGSYLIQFSYTVHPGVMGNPGPGNRSYTLCAWLHVRA
jgi:hypothetical protein